MNLDAPSLVAFREAQQTLSSMIIQTPVVQWVSSVLDAKLCKNTSVYAKLECMQFAGSFKARAALLKMLACTQERRRQGVVAASAGNHAIAVSYAADMLGISAKVVMPKTASSIRLQKCRLRKAEVILCESMSEAFDEAQRIAKSEGREFIHPFEGSLTALGTGTLGLEFFEQLEIPLDAIVVSVGGGGLAAGVASAIARLAPECEVFGVEPIGADSISKSIVAGEPVRLESLDTIASSLAAPYALPYSFSLCSKYLKDVVCVSDEAMCEAMAYIYYDLKLALEPGCAAVVAALFGPLRERLLGKRVGLVFCGSSIDAGDFHRCMELGEPEYRSFCEALLSGLNQHC